MAIHTGVRAIENYSMMKNDVTVTFVLPYVKFVPRRRERWEAARLDDQHLPIGRRDFNDRSLL